MNISNTSALSNRSGHTIVALLALAAFVWSSAGAAADALPSWPQRFEINGPESAAFGFIVTQPGPVAIDVQANGAPVVATLNGAAPRAAEQSGTGTLHLTYQITAQDMQKSGLWSVNVRLSPPAPGAAWGRAGGSVFVQAPPVDPAAAQALLANAQARAQASQQAMLQRPPDPQVAAAQVAQMDAVLNGRRAQFDQQRQQARAQMHAQLQPLAAAAQARLANRVGTRGLAPVGVSSTMTRLPPAEVQAARSAAVPERAASAQADLAAAGSGPGPQTVVANPVITALSVTRGQPGDPVMITGTGFAAGGEVHFIVNPGKDVVAHVDIWSDDKVFVSVPDVSGILGFNGQAYVVRAGDNVRSNIVPFQFVPGVEFRDLRSTMDRVLANPVYKGVYYTNATTIWRINDNPFSGFYGDDVLFASAKLKNGWVVEDAFVFCGTATSPCGGGALPTIVPRGSSAPAFRVHWWIGTGSGFSIAQVWYTFAVRIVGPKGVPDGVAVP